MTNRETHLAHMHQKRTKEKKRQNNNVIHQVDDKKEKHLDEEKVRQFHHYCLSNFNFSVFVSLLKKEKTRTKKCMGTETEINESINFVRTKLLFFCCKEKKKHA